MSRITTWLRSLTHGTCSVCGRGFRKADSSWTTICDGECYGFVLISVVTVTPEQRERLADMITEKQGRYGIHGSRV